MQKELKINYLIMGLYKVMEEQNQLSELLTLSEAIKTSLINNKKFNTFIEHELIDKQTKKLFFKEVIGQKYIYFLHWLWIVIDWNLIKWLSHIIESLTKFILIKQGTKIAYVSSARSFTTAQLANIKAKLTNKYKTNIHLIHVIDPKLLAGFKLEVDDMVMDYSIQNKLKLLLHNINKK